MAQSSGKAKFTLKLVVNEEKNKVVLAEACGGFIDVLFSLLTLPMGTIVRLLEQHRKSKIGCFSNLYTSINNIRYDDFVSQACKQMLLYPRSEGDFHCKRLKLNLHPTNGVKCYTCQSSCGWYSDGQCSCGALTKSEELAMNGVFVNGRCTFIVTDDLKVEVKETELVLEKLISLGYADVSKLGERSLGIGLDEVLSLLECVFSSSAPLTDAFLNKQRVTKIHEMISPCFDEAEPEMVISLKAFVNKEKKILFVECGEDFVELLLSFLPVPLEAIGEIFGDDFTFGCIRNLCRSFKDLSSYKETEHSPPKYMQMRDFITTQPRVYYHYSLYTPVNNSLATNGKRSPSCNRTVSVVLMDPKSSGSDQSNRSCGFLKKETKFTVLDDLTITSINSYSTVWLLKKFQTRADDLDVQVISITKTEVMNVLRASLVTASALNKALCNLIAKELKKKRPICETQLRRSQRKKT